MKIAANSIEEYIENLPTDKAAGFNKLRATIKKNLPKGFKEGLAYGMVGYCVPLSKYPNGYHCDPSLPLGFITIACQKNFVALYHMGIYCNPKLLNWFQEEYKKQVPTKLDMGKSCIRFKKPDEIPFKLIGELCSKITPDEWIAMYEEGLKQMQTRKPAKKISK